MRSAHDFYTLFVLIPRVVSGLFPGNSITSTGGVSYHKPARRRRRDLCATLARGRCVALVFTPWATSDKADWVPFPGLDFAGFTAFKVYYIANLPRSISR